MKTETYLNFGFIIVLPERNYGHLKSTVSSLVSQYPNAPLVCVTEGDTPARDVEEMQQLCPVFKGRNTITSLINEGLHNAKAEWNIVVMGGTFVGKGLVRRMLSPVRGSKDVLYAVTAEYNKMGKPVTLHDDFAAASLNGITINKDTFKEVGEFSDNPLEISKLMWALDATDKGCVFKGVLGAKLV